jgi:hypothetical protein
MNLIKVLESWIMSTVLSLFIFYLVVTLLAGINNISITQVLSTLGYFNVQSLSISFIMGLVSYYVILKIFWTDKVNRIKFIKSFLFVIIISLILDIAAYSGNYIQSFSYFLIRSIPISLILLYAELRIYGVEDKTHKIISHKFLH